MTRSSSRDAIGARSEGPVTKSRDGDTQPSVPLRVITMIRSRDGDAVKCRGVREAMVRTIDVFDGPRLTSSDRDDSQVHLPA